MFKPECIESKCQIFKASKAQGLNSCFLDSFGACKKNRVDAGLIISMCTHRQTSTGDCSIKEGKCGIKNLMDLPRCLRAEKDLNSRLGTSEVRGCYFPLSLSMIAQELYIAGLLAKYQSIIPDQVNVK